MYDFKCYNTPNCHDVLLLYKARCTINLLVKIKEYDCLIFTNKASCTINPFCEILMLNHDRSKIIFFSNRFCELFKL